MNDAKSMTICILEQQTKSGPLKASQLARLIEWAYEHVEVVDDLGE